MIVLELIGVKMKFKLKTLYSRKGTIGGDLIGKRPSTRGKDWSKCTGIQVREFRKNSYNIPLKNIDEIFYDSPGSMRIYYIAQIYESI